MTQSLLFLGAILLLRWVAHAQVPTTCVNAQALADKSCCPLYNGSLCGGPSRGTCATLSKTHCYPSDSSNLTNPAALEVIKALERRPMDTRMYWPTKIFDKVCICKDNWSGYDCSECRYGYELDSNGRNCVKMSKPRVRRNYLRLSKTEREYVISSLARANNITSRYSLLVQEPATADEALTENNFITNASVIDFLGWLHYYTAYTGDDGIDFAHGWSGFPTFHRQYLLFYDSELRWALNDMTFSLPYWDWTDEATRMQMFDGTTFSGTERRLCNKFASFTTFCDRSPPERDDQNRTLLCDSQKFWIRKPIERQVGSTEGHQQKEIRGLPSSRDVYEALQLDTYDDWPYDRSNNNVNSFRNMLEGFAKIPKKTYCNNAKSTVHEIHNDVHVFIGGTMGDVKFSPTDPIFVLHHSNIDRILEMWIRSKGANPSWFRPVHGSSPGHNAKDCIIPFLPLVRHEEMLLNSISLGYDYDSVVLPQPRPGNLTAAELRMCREGMKVAIKDGPCPSPDDISGGHFSQPAMMIQLLLSILVGLAYGLN